MKAKKLIPLEKLKKKAQDTFNAWIRHRDKDKGCISCGGPVQQAGHYFSAGHYSGLRFNETNTNGQCIRCNCYLSGNLIHYRQGLVDRYGHNTVKELEDSALLRKSAKWDRAMLELIIENYKNRTP